MAKHPLYVLLSKQMRAGYAARAVRLLTPLYAMVETKKATLLPAAELNQKQLSKALAQATGEEVEAIQFVSVGLFERSSFDIADGLDELILDRLSSLKCLRNVVEGGPLMTILEQQLFEPLAQVLETQFPDLARAQRGDILTQVWMNLRLLIEAYVSTLVTYEKHAARFEPLLQAASQCLVYGRGVDFGQWCVLVR